MCTVYSSAVEEDGMVVRKHLIYLILLLFPLQVFFLNIENSMNITMLALGASAVIFYFTQQRPVIYLVVLGMMAYGVAISMTATSWLAPAMTAMVLGWIGTIVILLLQHVSLADITDYAKKLIATDRVYVSLIGGVTLFGFLLRWFQFTETPVLSSDEASSAIFGLTYYDGTFNNPFISGWLEVPSMSFLIAGTSVNVFGHTVFALRIPSVIVGTAMIPLVIWAARPLMSRPFTLIAGLVVATCGLLLNFSRLGLVIINDSFYALLLLGIMLRSAKIVTSRTSVLLGIVTGVAQFGYASARSFGLLLIIWYGIGLLHTPKAWRNALGQLILCGSVALAVSSPLMMHYYKQPDNFRAPLQRASMILPDSPDGSSVLSRQAIELNLSPAQILWVNFKTSFFAFITGPVDGWYRSNFPILPLGFAVLFVIGLMTSLISWRSQSLQIIFVIVVLACVTASLSYPIAAGHRMINALGAIAIAIAVGAQALYQLIVPRVAALKWVLVAVLTLAVGQGALYGPYLYYSTFVTVEDGLGDGSMQIASQFGKYAQTLPAGTKIDVYELDYFSRGSTPVIDFLTKKLDYLAISGDTQPRPDAQIMVVPMERVPTVQIPDNYKKQTIKSINGVDLLIVAIAPTFLP
jgi:energy-converting hydrogenase Eha subunit C